LLWRERIAEVETLSSITWGEEASFELRLDAKAGTAFSAERFPEETILSLIDFAEEPSLELRVDPEAGTAPS
jgi:hypothetical protein